MWAQLIKMRVKDGQEGRLMEAFDALREAEQKGSGLLRTLVMRDQKDPAVVYALPLFESEEAARARENDLARENALREIRQILGAVFHEPEFVDLEVIDEFVP